MAQKKKITSQERTMLLGLVKFGANKELGIEIDDSRLYRHMLQAGLVEIGVHHQSVNWEGGDVTTTESKKLRLRLTDKGKAALE